MYPALQSCIIPEDQYSEYYNNMYQQQYQPQSYYSLQQGYQQGHAAYTYNHASYHGYNMGMQGSLPVTQHHGTQMAISTPVSQSVQSTSCSPTQRPIKPSYSYAALICMAINSTSEKKSTMREILTYIEQNFAYYRSNKKWHGTIRHDLTVNDCFVKMDPRPGQKACLWSVHPEFQDMFSNGSLRRRRYRFKQGSSSWLKARKQSAARRHRVHHSTVAGITSPQHTSGYSSLTDSPNTSCDDLTEILSSCNSLNELLVQDNQVPATADKLDDMLSTIPSFDDCVEDLYHSFQTDYYNTL